MDVSRPGSLWSHTLLACSDMQRSLRLRVTRRGNDDVRRVALLPLFGTPIRGPRVLVSVVRFSHGCNVCMCRGVRHWMRVKREQKRQTALRELSKPMLKHLLRWRERRRNQVGQARRPAMQPCQCTHMICLLAVTTGCRRHSWRAAAHEPYHEGPILHQEVHQCRYIIACLCALPWCVPSLTPTGIMVGPFHHQCATHSAAWLAEWPSSMPKSACCVCIGTR